MKRTLCLLCLLLALCACTDYTAPKPVPCVVSDGYIHDLKPGQVQCVIVVVGRLR